MGIPCRECRCLSLQAWLHDGWEPHNSLRILTSCLHLVLRLDKAAAWPSAKCFADVSNTRSRSGTCKMAGIHCD